MFIYDDNFLTEEEIQNIENVFWREGQMWSFNNRTHGNPKANTGAVDLGLNDTFYFTIDIKPELIGQEHQAYLNMINKFTQKNKIKFDEIARLKLNITTSLLLNDKMVPHVDWNKPHYVLLYYVNDSDGDTILFNESTDFLSYTTSVTELKSITPKRGSAILWPGNYFHAGTTPMNTPKRGVVNVNLATKEWPTL